MALGRVLVFGALWLSTVVGCGEEPVPCGDLECDGGQICVKRGAWMTEYLCVDDPCGGKTVTCDCAASACGMGFVCGGVKDREVGCYCPAC